MILKIFVVNQANRSWNVHLAGKDLDFSMTTNDCSDSTFYRNADRFLCLIHQGATGLTEETLNEVWSDRWDRLRDERVWWLLYGGSGYSIRSTHSHLHFLRYPIFDQNSIDADDLSRIKLFLSILEADPQPEVGLWDALYPDRVAEAAILLAILSAPPSLDRDDAIARFVRSTRDLRLAYEQCGLAKGVRQIPYLEWVEAIKGDASRVIAEDLRLSLGQVLD